jgi:hypothetical protein
VEVCPVSQGRYGFGLKSGNPVAYVHIVANLWNQNFVFALSVESRCSRPERPGLNRHEEIQPRSEDHSGAA